MPLPNVSFYCVTVAVPTAATSLYSLVQAVFNARTPQVIDASASTVQLTAAKGNGSTNIYVGDSTLNSTASPMVGVGAELAPGEGLFEPYQGGGDRTLDISTIFVQASAATTNYLNVRVRMSAA